MEAPNARARGRSRDDKAGLQKIGAWSYRDGSTSAANVSFGYIPAVRNVDRERQNLGNFGRSQCSEIRLEFPTKW
jgi:hypothetical protein